ncbi:MAG: sulfite exporter TauE/SafE family protein [Bacteroidetes bacterium]|nr:sulfite exporter TauE/SafE family protein [Bacteroidota bacterium]
MQHWEIFVFFFCIAAIYASVGFGGGSSYIAILALYALPFKELKLIALLCNVIVVAGGTYIYIKNGQVLWKKVLPLIIISIPMAFLGAKIKLEAEAYFIILGVCLLIASLLLWLKIEPSGKTYNQSANVVKEGLLGGSIGFLSGLVGIGGGIFLSPILNLMNWDTSKRIAATASLFILVNSLAGIAGQLSDIPQGFDYKRATILAVTVLLGGQFGSRISIRKFDMLWIRRITAVLVFAAGVEVLIKHLNVA